MEEKTQQQILDFLVRIEGDLQEFRKETTERLDRIEKNTER